jgi:hypothetical protein
VAGGGARIHIGAPPDAVFPWLLEGDRLLRWVGGLREHEQVTPIRVRQVLDPPVPGTGPMEVRLDVLIVEVPYRLRMRMTGPAGLSAEVSFVLADRDGGTDLGLDITTTSGPSARGLLGPVVVAGVGRRMRADLGRLKRLAEAEPAVYS